MEKSGKLSEALDPGFCTAEGFVQGSAGGVGQVCDMLPQWRKGMMFKAR